MSPQPLLGPSALATKCGGVPRPVDCSSLLFALKGQGDGQGAGRGAPQGGETERGQREQDGAPDRPQVRRGGREETRQKPGGRAMRDSQAARQPGRRRPREEKEGGSGVGERDGEMRARHRETDGQRGPDDQAWKVDGVRAQAPPGPGPRAAGPAVTGVGCAWHRAKLSGSLASSP